MGLLRAPDGSLVTVPDDQAGQAIAGGYTPVSSADAGTPVESEDRGTLGAVNSFATGTLSGLTLGASDYALKGLLNKGQFERMRQEREGHAIAGGAGQFVGALAPAVLTGGASAAEEGASLAARLGADVAGHTPAGYLSSLTSGISEGGGLADTIAAGSVEGAVQNAGVYLSDTALGDRDLSAEGMVGALGTGLAFGAGGAAAAHGIEAGTIAARRMFARVAEGGGKAAQLAAQDWATKSAASLESFDQAADAARAELAAARTAREQADIARQQAGADLAGARAGAPAADAARAPLATLDDNIGRIEATSGAAATGTTVPTVPAAATGGFGDLQKLVGEYDDARRAFDEMEAAIQGHLDVDVQVQHAVPIAEFGAPGAGGLRSSEELSRAAAEAGGDEAAAPVSASTGQETRQIRGVAQGTPAGALSPLATEPVPHGEPAATPSGPEPTSAAPAVNRRAGKIEIPAGFDSGLESDGVKLFQGEPSLREGVPNRRQINSKNYDKVGFVVRPSELAEQGVLGTAFNKQSGAAEIGGGWSKGSKVPAVEIDIDKAGKYFIANGNKRVLAAAADGDRPILVRFRPIAETYPAGEASVADGIKSAIAGKPASSGGGVAELGKLVEPMAAAKEPAAAVEKYGQWAKEYDEWQAKHGWRKGHAKTQPIAPTFVRQMQHEARLTQFLEDEKNTTGVFDRPEQIAKPLKNKQAREVAAEVVKERPKSTPRPAAAAEPAAEPHASHARSPRTKVVMAALDAVADAVGMTAAHSTGVSTAGAAADEGDPHSIASSAVAIADHMGLGRSDAVALTSDLRGQGFVDSRGQVTALGRVLIAAEHGESRAVEALSSALAMSGRSGESELESLLRGTQERQGAGKSLGEIAAESPERAKYVETKLAQREADAALFRGRALGARAAREASSYEGSAMAVEESRLQAEAAERRQLGSGATGIGVAEHPLAIKQLEIAHDEALERAATATEPAERAAAAAEAKVIERQLTSVGSRRGPVEDVAAMAAVTTRVEKAAAALTEAIGDRAPAAAREAAAGFRAAEADASRKSLARIARAADDNHAEWAPKPGELQPGAAGPDRRPGPTGKQTIETARQRQLEAEAGYAKARVAETQAAAGARAAKEARADAVAALPPAPAPAAPHAAGHSKIGTAIHVIGLAGELGVPGIPRPHDIPVIGPLLSAYLKYRVLRATVGRFVGRVPATAEAQAASLAARTKDAIARAVDRSLGLVARNTPIVRSSLIAGANVVNDALKKRAFDDGQPGAPKDASTSQLVAVRMREVAAAATQPQLVTDMVRRQTASLSDPDLIQALENHLMAMYQHLNATAPKGPPPNPYTAKQWLPSPAEALQWGRRLAVANDPQVAFDALNARQLTPDMADTLRAVYPRLFALAQQRLIERAADIEHPVPYRQLVRNGLLFDEPLHASMQAANIAVLSRAMSSAASGPAPGGAAGGGPPVPSIAGNTNLSQMYESAADRRAAAR